MTIRSSRGRRRGGGKDASSRLRGVTSASLARQGCAPKSIQSAEEVQEEGDWEFLAQLMAVGDRVVAENGSLAAGLNLATAKQDSTGGEAAANAAAAAAAAAAVAAAATAAAGGDTKMKEQLLQLMQGLQGQMEKMQQTQVPPPSPPTCLPCHSAHSSSHRRAPTRVRMR